MPLSPGLIFDLKVSPLSVVSSTSTILQDCSHSRLNANVSIPNSDIGFVKAGQSVSVELIVFPLVSLDISRVHLFLLVLILFHLTQTQSTILSGIVISLKEQSVLSGTNKLNLQSGMGITANIKLRDLAQPFRLLLIFLHDNWMVLSVFDNFFVNLSVLFAVFSQL